MAKTLEKPSVESVDSNALLVELTNTLRRIADAEERRLRAENPRTSQERKLIAENIRRYEITVRNGHLFSDIMSGRFKYRCTMSDTPRMCVVVGTDHQGQAAVDDVTRRFKYFYGIRRLSQDVSLYVDYVGEGQPSVDELPEVQRKAITDMADAEKAIAKLAAKLEGELEPMRAGA